MKRRQQLGGGAFKSTLRIAAALVCAVPLLVTGCSGATSTVFAPTALEISPDAASGPDYIADGSIDQPGEEDYYELVLKQSFNTVTIMTGGPTDTAGQVETEQRVPITTECEGKRHKATPPCVWGADEDIATPNSERSEKFNTMPASKNFIWEGSLDAGTYYIRVTGPNGVTGPYELTVETENMQCPSTETDPFGYYCDD